MKKITAPGIYDLPIDVYHDEPCAWPSIGSGGLREILDCPAKYWFGSPLNPKRQRPDKEPWSIGKAAHDFILEGDEVFRARNYVMPEDANLHREADRELRDEAVAAGLTVISHDQFQAIRAMRAALSAHEFAANAFKGGDIERSLVWQDEETGVWLRCRPDLLPTAMQFIPDYKTAASAKPADFMRQCWNLGYHQQAALYLDGIEAVTGHRPESFFFVVQEKAPPYVVTCVVLDDVAIGWGRIQNRKAIHTFADCLAADRWPGYETDVVEGSLPIFAERELERLHERGAFEPETKEQAA